MDYRKYLSVPYVPRGRDTSGWDCYGLYRFMLAEHHGVQADSYAEQYAGPPCKATDRAISLTLLRNLPSWRRVEVATHGCAVVFNIAGQPLHCGYVTDQPDTMLHAMQGRGTCIERFDSLNWQKRIEGIYSWN